MNESIQSDKEQNEDVRNAARQRVLQRITISYTNGQCSSGGVIKNISETGALIKVDDGIVVPDHFSIVNEFIGYDVECEVIRRQGLLVGVKFVSPVKEREAKRKQTVGFSR